MFYININALLQKPLHLKKKRRSIWTFAMLGTYVMQKATCSNIVNVCLVKET